MHLVQPNFCPSLAISYDERGIWQENFKKCFRGRVCPRAHGARCFPMADGRPAARYLSSTECLVAKDSARASRPTDELPLHTLKPSVVQLGEVGLEEEAFSRD